MSKGAIRHRRTSCFIPSHSYSRMNMNILICHGDPEFRLAVRVRLQEEFPQQRLNIDEASNEAAAIGKLTQDPSANFDFFITTLELSPSPDFSVDQGHRGIAIVRTIRKS